jgi:hypothetical protein
MEVQEAQPAKKLVVVYRNVQMDLLLRPMKNDV